MDLKDKGSENGADNEIHKYHEPKYVQHPIRKSTNTDVKHKKSYLSSRDAHWNSFQKVAVLSLH